MIFKDQISRSSQCKFSNKIVLEKCIINQMTTTTASNTEFNMYKACLPPFVKQCIKCKLSNKNYP